MQASIAKSPVYQHLEYVLKMADKALEYSTGREAEKNRIRDARKDFRELLIGDLADMLGWCIDHPNEKRLYLGSIEMFRFQGTLVILIFMNIGRKKLLFWQGALDIETKALTEVPAGRDRMVVIER